MLWIWGAITVFSAWRYTVTRNKVFLTSFAIGATLTGVVLPLNINLALHIALTAVVTATSTYLLAKMNK